MLCGIEAQRHPCAARRRRRSVGRRSASARATCSSDSVTRICACRIAGLVVRAMACASSSVRGNAGSAGKRRKVAGIGPRGRLVVLARDQQAAFGRSQRRARSGKPGLGNRHVGAGRFAHLEPGLGGAQFLGDQPHVALLVHHQFPGNLHVDIGAHRRQQHLLFHLHQRLPGRQHAVPGDLDPQPVAAEVEQRPSRPTASARRWSLRPPCGPAACLHPT